MRSCLHAIIVHHGRLHSVNLAIQTAAHARPEDMNGSLLVKATWPAVCVEHPTGWSCCHPKSATCQKLRSGRRNLQAAATRGDTCGHLGDVPPVAAPVCVIMQRLLHRTAGLVLIVSTIWSACRCCYLNTMTQQVILHEARTLVQILESWLAAAGASETRKCKVSSVGPTLCHANVLRLGQCERTVHIHNVVVADQAYVRTHARAPHIPAILKRCPGRHLCRDHARQDG